MLYLNIKYLVVWIDITDIPVLLFIIMYIDMHMHIDCPSFYKKLKKNVKLISRSGCILLIRQDTSWMMYLL